MKKALFALVLFIFAFAVPVTVYTVVSNSADFDVREKAAEVDADNLSAPRIVSIPSTGASVGEKYTYIVKAVDSDGDVLEYMVTERPDWLVWNDELKVLEGTPASEDSGAFDVKITVGDGKWLDTQRFQIYIQTEDGLDWDEDNGDGGSGSDGSDGAEESGSEESVSGESESSVPANVSADQNADQNQERDSEEYGLVPVISDSGRQSGGSVLGASDTQLPNTALIPGLLGGSIGFAVICVSLFLWADAQWNIVNKISLKMRFARGEQITFKVAGGRIVKKRELEL